MPRETMLSEPVLATPRLELVELTREVASARLRGAGFVADLVVGSQVRTIEFPAEWPDSGLVILQLLAETQADSDGTYPGQFVAVERATGQAVGLLGCKGGPDEGGAVEIGYGIIPSRRGMGWATDAVALLCDHLLDDPAVRRITAATSQANSASQRVLARNGFTQVGTDWSPDEGPLIWWQRDRQHAGATGASRGLPVS